MTQYKNTHPVVIVTGASRGFGRAVAAALLDRGWTVVGDARNAKELETTARELNSAQLIALSGDVTDASHRDALVAAAVNAGPLCLLVNNASRLGPSPQPALSDYPASELWSVYQTNVFAPLALIQTALPALTDSAERSSTSAPTRRSSRTQDGVGMARRRPRSTNCRPYWQPRPPPCRCTSSTRATCGPRCTRPHSPARTSPTAQSRSLSYRHCCDSSTPGRPPVGTGQQICYPERCHDSREPSAHAVPPGGGLRRHRAAGGAWCGPGCDQIAGRPPGRYQPRPIRRPR